MIRKSYETKIKEEVNFYLSITAKYEDHFIGYHGLPVWESAGWINYNNQDMLLIPLLNSEHMKRFIVGVVFEDQVYTMVTEVTNSRGRVIKYIRLINQVYTN